MMCIIDTYAALFHRDKMEMAHRSFLAAVERLPERIREAFGIDMDVDVVFYLGLCNGAHRCVAAVEKFLRILQHPLHPHLKVQMRPGGASGAANRADNIALLQVIARFDSNLTEVGVHTDYARAVVDIHHIAAEKEITGMQHAPRSSSLNRCAGSGSNVHATVRIALLSVKNAAHSKTSGIRTGGREDKIECGRLWGIATFNAFLYR